MTFSLVSLWMHKLPWCTFSCSPTRQPKLITKLFLMCSNLADNAEDTRPGPLLAEGRKCRRWSKCAPVIEPHYRRRTKLTAYIIHIHVHDVHDVGREYVARWVTHSTQHNVISARAVLILFLSLFLFLSFVRFFSYFSFSVFQLIQFRCMNREIAYYVRVWAWLASIASAIATDRRKTFRCSQLRRINR